VALTADGAGAAVRNRWPPKRACLLLAKKGRSVRQEARGGSKRNKVGGWALHLL